MSELFIKQVEALKVKSPRQRELALKWIRFDIKDVITRRNTAIKNRRKLEYEIVAAPRRFNFFPHNSGTLKCSPTFLRRTRIIGLNYVSRLKCLNLNCWIIFRPRLFGEICNYRYSRNGKWKDILVRAAKTYSAIFQLS